LLDAEGKVVELEMPVPSSLLHPLEMMSQSKNSLKSIHNEDMLGKLSTRLSSRKRNETSHNGTRKERKGEGREGVARQDRDAKKQNERKATKRAGNYRERG